MKRYKRTKEEQKLIDGIGRALRDLPQDKRVPQTRAEADRILLRNGERRRSATTRTRLRAKVALLFLGAVLLCPTAYNFTKNTQVFATGTSISNALSLDSENSSQVSATPHDSVETSGEASAVFVLPQLEQLGQNVLYWRAEVERVVRHHHLTSGLSQSEQARITYYLLLLIKIESNGIYQSQSRSGAFGLTQVMGDMHIERISSCVATWSTDADLIKNAPVTGAPATSTDQVIQAFLNNPAAQMCAGIEVLVGDFYRPEEDQSILATLAGYNGGTYAKNWVNNWLQQVPAGEMSSVYAALRTGAIANLPAYTTYVQGKNTYIANLTPYYSSAEVRVNKAEEVQRYLLLAAQYGITQETDIDSARK